MGGLILLSVGLGLLTLCLVGAAAYVNRPVGHGKYFRPRRNVILPLFVPLILTLTVCAIADAGGGFNPRASRRAASRQAGRNFANGVHVDVGRGVVIGRDVHGFNVRGARSLGFTRTIIDSRGRIITVDEFGRVIAIR